MEEIQNQTDRSRLRCETPPDDWLIVKNEFGRMQMEAGAYYFTARSRNFPRTVVLNRCAASFCQVRHEALSRRMII
jgi:hypothetical protein